MWFAHLFYHQDLKLKEANNLSLLIQNVFCAGVCLAYLSWKCICGVRVHATAHQSKWCKFSMSADTFPNLFHAIFCLIYTQKGSVRVVSIGTVCFYQGVLNNSQLLFQVFLWALTDYDCTFGSWFFYLDLYLFLNRALPQRNVQDGLKWTCHALCEIDCWEQSWMPERLE